MSSFDDYLAGFDGDPGYLDWAAFGPLSAAVRQDAIADLELSGSGRASSLALVEEHVAEAEQLVAALLGMPASHVVLQPSTTHGLQQAVYGLPAGGVLVSTAEFPACTVPVQRAADAMGRITPQFFTPDGGVDAERVAHEVTDDTVALVVSLVDFRTGYRADLSELREALGPDRLLIVDATQAFGTVEADYAAADVICAHGYKWVRAGRGTGFASYSDRALERLTPTLSATAGMGDSLIVDAIVRPAAGARGFRAARPDALAAARLSTALTELGEAGIDRIEAAIAQRTARVIALADVNDFEVLTPRASERRAGIVTVVPQAGDVGRLGAALANEGLTVTTRADTIRLSIHAGTSDDALMLLSDGFASYTQSRAW